MDTRFAQGLRALRQQKRLSQTELAQRSGLALRTLFYWESGEYQPRIPELQAVLSALEATPEETTQLFDLIDTPRGLRLAQEELSAKLPEGFAGVGVWDLLRAMRLRSQLTQAELSANLHISRQAVMRWESGNNYISSENLERLCDLLHAAPEERQALQERRLTMPHWKTDDWRKVTIEEAAAHWHEIQQNHDTMSADYRPQTPLFELQVLAMKQFLSLQTQPNDAARRLMAKIETDHAMWLHFQNREREAGFCVNRALNLVRDEGVPQDFWGELLNIAAYPGYTKQRKRGAFGSLSLIEEWIPRLPPGLVRTQQLCDKSLYTGMLGQSNHAMRILEQAEQSMDRGQEVTAGETYYYVLTRERLELVAGNNLEISEGLLTQCPNDFQRIHILLLWINTLLIAGETREASRYLTRVRAILTPETPRRLHQVVQDYSLQI